MRGSSDTALGFCHLHPGIVQQKRVVLPRHFGARLLNIRAMHVVAKPHVRHCVHVFFDANSPVDSKSSMNQELTGPPASAV